MQLPFVLVLVLVIDFKKIMECSLSRLLILNRHIPLINQFKWIIYQICRHNYLNSPKLDYYCYLLTSSLPN